jgi:dehydrogenase/reductase SDR family member 12
MTEGPRDIIRSLRHEHVLPRTIDALLEATVVGSFSRLGFVARRRIWRWADPARLEGHNIVVTGASSGIGRATALGLARLGADLWLVGRDPGRLRAAREAALRTGGGGAIEIASLDLVDAEAVTAFAGRVRTANRQVDALVHIAGAMFAERAATPEGTEMTVATHVLAAFRLSCLLLPLLSRAPAPVIVTVSSGGMYTQRFDLGRLEMTADGYRGATAYARAKRAQVVLAGEWGRRWGDAGLASYVMHPGWVDTAGLKASLPGFARLGPLLRRPEQGADTVIWLAADGPRSKADGPSQSAAGEDRPGIWLDRRRRGVHYLPTTWRSRAGDEADGSAVWDWCASRTEAESR